MEFDDSTRRALAHLEIAPDAYLLGDAEFRSPFTLWDRATRESRTIDSLSAIPADVVKTLEAAGQIVRVDIPDASQVAFRSARWAAK